MFKVLLPDKNSHFSNIRYRTYVMANLLLWGLDITGTQNIDMLGPKHLQPRLKLHNPLIPPHRDTSYHEIHHNLWNPRQLVTDNIPARCRMGNMAEHNTEGLNWIQAFLFLYLNR